MSSDFPMFVRKYSEHDSEAGEMEEDFERAC
jgi:hypothetical protein